MDKIVKMQKVNSCTSDMKLTCTEEILIDEEVLILLSKIDFLDSWDALYHSCAWATVYQSKEFVSTWYKMYHKEYLPIVVQGVTGGKLTGLLTLAKNNSGLIIGAGESYAEYQVWLAAAADQGSFIKNALLKIKKEFPRCDIQLKFVPGKTPLNWIKAETIWKRRCILRVYPQPLMMINEVSIATELRKNNNKINRLKKLGDLKFEHITDYQIFSSILDELAIQFDFRKGAMYNKTPFQQDPLRKKFFLALFEYNILHTTVLKLNDEIIASNVGAISKNRVHLHGINTHAPYYAKSSPGILHFLMLAKLLAEQGIEEFDLTPGKNSYKEELATAHLPAYELSVTGSIKFHIKELRKKIFYTQLINNKKILKGLAIMGVRSNDVKIGIRELVKEKIQKAKEQGLGSFISKIITGIRVTQKNKIYKIKPYLAKHIIPVKKNNLGDLLLYHSKGSKLSKREFLFDAMRKLEKSKHVYSLAEEGSLLSCVWLDENLAEHTNPAIKQKSISPNGSVILYDFYCEPGSRERFKAFITTVAYEVSSNNCFPYAIIDATDLALCKTVEEAGFIDVSANTRLSLA